MTDDKLILLLNLVPFGLIALIYPRLVGKLVEKFMRFSNLVLKGDIADKDLKVGLFYIRALGIAWLSLAVLVYFDLVD